MQDRSNPGMLGELGSNTRGAQNMSDLNTAHCSHDSCTLHESCILHITHLWMFFRL